jgi:hypothetical protein
MAELALTVGGSRTFSDGVKISWTPSTTTNKVDLSVSIGGDEVWDQDVQGDGTANINVSGDNYKLTGSLSVKFGDDGTTGQIRANDVEWTVQGDSHAYTGLVGNW